MKKAIIILIVFVISIIIFSIILFIYNPYIFGDIICDIYSDCDYTENLNEIILESSSSGEVSICDNLRDYDSSGGTPRAKCYIEHAIENKDENICLKMKELKLNSVYGFDLGEGFFGGGKPINCYTGVIILKRDPNRCEDIEIFKGDSTDKEIKAEIKTCYTLLATRLQNKELCENLEGEDRLSCLIPFSDISICDQFSPEKKGFCLERFEYL